MPKAILIEQNQIRRTPDRNALRIVTQESRAAPFSWGTEPTDSPGSLDGLGDLVWWESLKNWLSNDSTVEERAACVGKCKRIELLPISATEDTLTYEYGMRMTIMQCVGADQDGPNTLVFSMKNASCTDECYFSGSQFSNGLHIPDGIATLVVKIGSMTLGSNAQTLYSSPWAKPCVTWPFSVLELYLEDTYNNSGEHTQGYPVAGYTWFKRKFSDKIKYSSDEYGNKTGAAVRYFTRTGPGSAYMGSTFVSLEPVLSDGGRLFLVGTTGFADHYDLSLTNLDGTALTTGVYNVFGFIMGGVIPKRNEPSSLKTSKFTIGTSTNGWTEYNCDYLCDGTADDVEINAAIQALPETGGKIVLLDGTYNIAGSININKPGVTLSGNGSNTVLKRSYDSTSSQEGIITCASKGIVLENFVVDGNKATYTSTLNCCIYIKDSNSVVGNITVKNGYSGIELNNSAEYNTIANNYVIDTHFGIRLFNSNYNIIDSNICLGNISGILLTTYDDILSFGKNNIIKNNILEGNSDTGILVMGDSNLIVGNNVKNSEKSGIYVDSMKYTDTAATLVHSQNNIVASNVCDNNTTLGIACKGNSNLVIGNLVENSTTGILVLKLAEAEKNSQYNNLSKNLVSNCGKAIQIEYSLNTNINSNLIRPITDGSSIILAGTDNSYNFVTGNDIALYNYILEGGTENTFFNNYVGPSQFERFWGIEPTDSLGSKDGIGDEKWWTKLNNWVVNDSTAEERQLCVGKCKRLELAPLETTSSNSYVIMQCIGADQDGPNTLTFLSKNLPTDITQDMIKTINLGIDSLLENRIPFSTDGFIKTISKRKYSFASNKVKVITYKFWLPSRLEMGGECSSNNNKKLNTEYTEGYPIEKYDFYIDNNSKIKYLSDNYGNSNGTVGIYLTRSGSRWNIAETSFDGTITYYAYNYHLVSETGEVLRYNGRTGDESKVPNNIYNIPFAFTIGVNT